MLSAKRHSAYIPLLYCAMRNAVCANIYIFAAWALSYSTVRS